MKIIDNVNELLGDDLKKETARGKRLRIAASTFSIFAFEALKEELQGLEELNFIFTAPTFVANAATDKLTKQRREFYIPQHDRESSLYGTEFEIRLRNKLTQRAIARECAEWIRRNKVTFKSNSTGSSMQQFAVVDDRAAYMPLQGFTSADLGYEQGNAVSNLVNKIDESPLTANYLQTFDQIWHSPNQVQDVTELVYEHIATVYAENSPERIYFLVLYNIFSEFLEDLSEDVLPNDLTGYKDTLIWNQLYDFQKDAAMGVINKLETYNGCILADSVGLGKTFSALAVIKYYELRNKSVLVLAPKKLEDNWTTYNANLKTNMFASDRFNYNVVAHTDLSRTSGYAGQMRLDQINWGNYDLVVIDESHNFRNASYSEEKETRYQRLMRMVIQEGVKTKVLMLSATPVNTRFNDLKNQLALAYEGAPENLSSKLPLATTLDQVFREAQIAFNHWSDLPAGERTADSILSMLDFDFFEILDAVTIARSRKHIQQFYDTSEVGPFPDRRPPISLRVPLTDLDSSPDFNEIFDMLSSLSLAAYAPFDYVFASRRQKYEDLYNVTGGTARGNLGIAGRQRGVQTFMTVSLLKRLESSVEAFRITLRKVEAAVNSGLDAIATNEQKLSDIVDALSELESEDEDFELPEPGTVGSKFQIELTDIDLESWGRDLRHDLVVLHELISEMEQITPAHDLKLQELIGHVRAKANDPINPGNKKVLVFSAFADTAKYLYREMTSAIQDELTLGLVTGGSNATTAGRGFDFQSILTLFSPHSKHKELIMPEESAEIDILIGTDCISEGQNLQDCDYLINYDIHWNPVRIIQRFGRIDRIGSTNSTIQLVNFWPDISLDEYINLKERVENRMVIADLSATADDNPLTQESSETEFRRDQLKRLQDEVVELEDMRTGVSITDLGLNDFRMDLIAYMEKYGDLASMPRGLHAAIPSNPDQGLPPGAVFVLRNVDESVNVNRHNRLHPYYLVYLDNKGELVAGHTEPKKLLDLIRGSCSNRSDPVPAAYRVFNNITDDGGDMSCYSDLLSQAIRSLLDVTEEKDIDSLFAGSKTSALNQTFSGLDDFELVAFLAVVDPEETG